MYGIGDNVVYGAQGVMKIVDITEQELGDTTRRYYVMKEYASVSPSLTYVPFDNELLTSQMQPLLTKDEIIAAVKAANAMGTLEWIEENRARSESYKRILASADRVMMLVMIRSVYLTGKRREEEGKKNYVADENIMKKAEKYINVEFSLVLGIPESDVPAFIDSI
jgi:CarD family transcriptional regulator